MGLPISRPRARRRPRPDLLQLDGFNYRLGKPAKGEQLDINQAPINEGVSPPNYGYSAADPKDVQTQEWRMLVNGMGLQVQEGPNTDRSYYCLNGDTCAGHFLKGPQLTVLTPTAVDTNYPVERFFSLGGKLYALNGRYCLQLSGGVWVVAQDFGSGTHARGVIVFYGNAPGVSQYAFIALGGGTADPAIYRFDGTAWSQHATLKAECFMSAGGKLYIADATNRLRTPLNITDDVWVAAVFTTYTIGSQDTKIVDMTVTASGTGFLLIFKEDQMWSLAVGGNPVELFPQMRNSVEASNGKVHGDFLGATFARYGSSVWRVQETYFGSGALVASPAGMERLRSNQSPVNGFISAMEPHGAFYLFMAIQDDQGNGYLAKLVPTKFTEQLSPSGERIPTNSGPEAIHGSITNQYVGKYITSMHKDTIGAPANHTMLYCGFSNGDIGSFILPCTFDPAACHEYIFSKDDAYFNLPWWHGVFANEVQGLRRVTFVSNYLSTSQTATLLYATDTVSAQVDLPLHATTSPRQQISFPTGITTTLARLTLKISGGGGARQADAPAPYVESLALESNLWISPMQRKYRFPILLSPIGVLSNGSQERRTIDTLRAQILTTKDKKTPVSVALPNGETRWVRLQDYHEGISWDDALGNFESTIFLDAYDEGVQPVYGTMQRLDLAKNMGTLNGRTMYQLENF